MPMFDNAHSFTINNGLFVDNGSSSDAGQALVKAQKPEH
jgi:hypothetical protein